VSRQHGYLYVRIQPLRRNICVHVLVCESFYGQRPVGAVTRHLNGNERDNTLGNLRWGTRAENEADKKLHGTFRHYSGNAKLSRNDIQEIIEKYGTGKFTYKQLGDEYGITGQAIGCVIRGDSWKRYAR
jgi:hypothetical protein